MTASSRQPRCGRQSRTSLQRRSADGRPTWHATLLFDTVNATRSRGPSGAVVALSSPSSLPHERRTAGPQGAKVPVLSVLGPCPQGPWPIEDGVAPTTAQIKIAQAQLLGWLTGLLQAGGLISGGALPLEGPALHELLDDDARS